MPPAKKASAKKAPAKKAPAKKAPAKKAPAKKKLVKHKVKVVSTVCREGYRPNKIGRCIKNKVVEEKLVRNTVCLEGYKISKDGRCIKDKNYQTIVASVPVADLIDLSPGPSISAPQSLSMVDYQFGRGQDEI